MLKYETSPLLPGVYIINWQDGTVSLATVGNLYSGYKWFSPQNWVSTVPAGIASDDWHLIRSVEYLDLGPSLLAHQRLTRDQRHDTSRPKTGTRDLTASLQAYPQPVGSTATPRQPKQPKPVQPVQPELPLKHPNKPELTTRARDRLWDLWVASRLHGRKGHPGVPNKRGKLKQPKHWSPEPGWVNKFSHKELRDLDNFGTQAFNSVVNWLAGHGYGLWRVEGRNRSARSTEWFNTSK
jgi:hypothetical protein